MTNLLHLSQFHQFVGQELHRPADAIVGRGATCPGNQCGLGLAIQLAAGAGARALAEGGLHPLGDKPLADAFNGSTPDMQGCGNGTVGDTRISILSNDGVTVLGTDDDGGPGQYSLLAICAPYTGTYYGRIAAFGSQTGTYMAFLTCSFMAARVRMQTPVASPEP